MFRENCDKYLSSIAISVIISFIFTLLFFNGVFSNILFAIAFALILALLSLIILAILGTSDNGYTRTALCKNSIFLLISILGSIFTNLFALLIPLSPGSILSAIIVGFAFFFFTLNLFSLIILLICIVRFP